MWTTGRELKNDGSEHDEVCHPKGNVGNRQLDEDCLVDVSQRRGRCLFRTRVEREYKQRKANPDSV